MTQKKEQKKEKTEDDGDLLVLIDSTDLALAKKEEPTLTQNVRPREEDGDRDLHILLLKWYILHPEYPSIAFSSAISVLIPSRSASQGTFYYDFEDLFFPALCAFYQQKGIPYKFRWALSILTQLSLLAPREIADELLLWIQQETEKIQLDKNSRLRYPSQSNPQSTTEGTS